jgi:hydroxyacylglutathione hydrolase
LDNLEATIAIEIITRPVGPLQANCYVVYEPGGSQGFIVDPGGDPEVIIAVLSEAAAKAAAILITHGHHDHIGAVAELSAATGAEIIGSSEADAVLADPERYRLFPGMPDIGQTRVDRILTGGEKLDIAGMDVEAVATPGHSQGSLCYYIPGGLFVGDLLFHGSVGRTDLPGGSFKSLADSIKELMRRFPPDTVVYPGHGNTTTLIAEKENNIFLEDIVW